MAVYPHIFLGSFPDSAKESLLVPGPKEPGPGEKYICHTKNLEDQNLIGSSIAG